MKTHIKLLVLAVSLAIASISVQSVSAMETPKEGPSTMNALQKQQRLDEITAKVEAIKEMDRSQMTKEDRLELKKELKSMKQEAKVIRGGVYISVGALIIIIILLIILL